MGTRSVPKCSLGDGVLGTASLLCLDLSPTICLSYIVHSFVLTYSHPWCPRTFHAFALSCNHLGGSFTILVAGALPPFEPNTFAYAIFVSTTQAWIPEARCVPYQHA